MATIPVYQQRVAPSGRSPLRAVDSRLGGESQAAFAQLANVAGQTAQRGLQRVRAGQIAEQRKQEAEQKKLEQEAEKARLRQEERARATKATTIETEANIAAEEAYRQARANAPPGGEGFAPAVEEYLDQNIKAVIEANQDDPELQLKLHQKLSGLRQKMTLRAHGDQAADRLDHAETAYSTAMDTLSSQAVSEPGELSSLIAQANNIIDEQSPYMTQAERAEDRRKAKTTLAEAAIGGMVEKNPAVLLRDLKDGRYDQYIDGKTKSSSIDRAQAEVKSIEAKHKAKTNAAEKVVAREVKDALYVMDRGHIPPNIDALQKQASGFPELKQALDEAMVDVHDVAAFGRLPGHAREALLQESTANKNPTKRQLEREERFAKRSSEIDKMLSDDPIAAAVETGVIDAPAPLEDDIVSRRELAAIVEETYGVETSGLTKAEAQSIGQGLKGMGTPEKLQHLVGLREGLGDRGLRLALPALAEDDPTTAAAVSISMTNPALAAEVFEGQKVIGAMGSDVMPGPGGEDGYNTLANSYLGDALEFARPEDREAMVQSALAVEAARRNKLGLLTKDDFSPEVFQEVLGQVVGGVVKYNDESIIPPSPDIDEDGFEEVIETITDDDLPAMGGPFFDRDGDPVAWDDIKESGHLKSFGAGKYFVFFGDRPLAGADGKPAEMVFDDHLDTITSRINTQRRRGFLDRFGLTKPDDEPGLLDKALDAVGLGDE